MAKNKLKIELVKNEMEMLNHADSGFNITRTINGQTVQIELTGQEVENVFRLQEHNYNVSDIKMVLEGMEDENELQNHTAESICADDTLMEKIVSDYEESLEDHDTGWEVLVLNAINENITKMEPYGGSE